MKINASSKFGLLAYTSFPIDTHNDCYQLLPHCRQKHKTGKTHNFFLLTMSFFVKKHGALNLYQISLLPNLFSNYWYYICLSKLQWMYCFVDCYFHLFGGQFFTSISMVRVSQGRQCENYWCIYKCFNMLCYIS